jgi:hypothetical protein
VTLPRGGSSNAFPSRAGIGVNWSPLCVRSTICTGTGSDEAVATDPLVLMAVEASARSTLQHAIECRAVRPIARNASLRSEVFGNMASIPRMRKSYEESAEPKIPIKSLRASPGCASTVAATAFDVNDPKRTSTRLVSRKEAGRSRSAYDGRVIGRSSRMYAASSAQNF